MLKVLAGTSGAVAAGSVLPDKWVDPIVDTVVLPAHAQASPLTFALSFPANFEGANGPVVFDFDVTGTTPISDANLDIVDLLADVNLATENIDVSVEGNFIGTFFDGGGDNACPGLNSDTLVIPLAILAAAAADNTVSITLTPSAGVNEASCLPTSGTLVLSFSSS